MATRKKAKRTTNSYLKSSQNLKSFVPSLAKYRRRKTLTRWEKAAITRAENKIKEASRGGQLVPLTKRQAKKLDKEVVIGNGIRAVRMRGLQRNAKIDVKKGDLTLIWV